MRSRLQKSEPSKATADQQNENPQQQQQHQLDNYFRAVSLDPLVSAGPQRGEADGQPASCSCREQQNQQPQVVTGPRSSSLAAKSRKLTQSIGADSPPRAAPWSVREQEASGGVTMSDQVPAECCQQSARVSDNFVSGKILAMGNNNEKEGAQVTDSGNNGRVDDNYNDEQATRRRRLAGEHKETENDEKKTKKKKKSGSSVHPLDAAGVISQLFFGWMMPIIWRGWRFGLRQADLPELPSRSESCKSIGETLAANWQRELDACKVSSTSLSPTCGSSKKTGAPSSLQEGGGGGGKDGSYGRAPSLARVLLKTHGKFILSNSLLAFFTEVVCKLSSAYSVGQMLFYISQRELVAPAASLIFATPPLPSSGPQNESTTSDGTVWVHAVESVAGTTNTIDPLTYWTLALVLAVSSWALCAHFYGFQMMRVGLHVRVGCSYLIYRKSLRLAGREANSDTIAGKMINLISNDLDKFTYVFIMVPFLWIGPIQTIVAIYLLWPTMGPACLGSLLVMAILIPIQLYLGKKSASYRRRIAAYTDERVRLLNETMANLRLIKLYGWEQPFRETLNESRRLETNLIKRVGIVKSISEAFIYISSKLNLFITIVFHCIVFGGKLDARTLFTSMAMLQNVQFTMTHLIPSAIWLGRQSLVSIERIGDFLLTKEFAPSPNLDTGPVHREVIRLWSGEGTKASTTPVGHSVFNDLSYLFSHIKNNNNNNTGCPPERKIVDSGGRNVLVEYRNVCARWPTAETQTLDSISFRLESKGLIVICGQVASGKSSLFMSLLNELPISKGQAKIRGSLSYSSQTSWIFNGTVRDNIIFGHGYKEDRYQEVVQVCALRRDFDLLEYGDLTYIQEDSLSGGQKARVNLARCLYRESDIYLLDDPFSAIDGRVADHIAEQAILRFLSNKLVLLATHRISLLKHSSKILLLDEGKQLAFCDYSELRHRLLSANTKFDYFNKHQLKRLAFISDVLFEESEAIEPRASIDETNGNIKDDGGKNDEKAIKFLGIENSTIASNSSNSEDETRDNTVDIGNPIANCEKSWPNICTCETGTFKNEANLEVDKINADANKAATASMDDKTKSDNFKDKNETNDRQVAQNAGVINKHYPKAEKVGANNCNNNNSTRNNEQLSRKTGPDDEETSSKKLPSIVSWYRYYTQTSRTRLALLILTFLITQTLLSTVDIYLTVWSLVERNEVLVGEIYDVNQQLIANITNDSVDTIGRRPLVNSNLSDIIEYDKLPGSDSSSSAQLSPLTSSSVSYGAAGQSLTLPLLQPSATLLAGGIQDSNNRKNVDFHSEPPFGELGSSSASRDSSSEQTLSSNGNLLHYNYFDSDSHEQEQLKSNGNNTIDGGNFSSSSGGTSISNYNASLTTTTTSSIVGHTSNDDNVVVVADGNLLEESEAILNVQPIYRPLYSIVYNFTSGQHVIACTILLLVLFSSCALTNALSIITSAQSAIILYRKLTDNALFAKVQFFDSNPIGRFLNRATRDIGNLDESIPYNANQAYDVLLQTAATFIVVGLVDITLALPSLVVAFICSFFHSIHVKPTKTIRRLEGMSKSPIITHISTTLNGLQTIRATKSERRFEQLFMQHQDKHTSIFLLYIGCDRSIAVCLDWLTASYTSLIACWVVVSGLTGPSAGLVITSAMLLSGLTQHGVMKLTETESLMTSVERVIDYCNLPQEEPKESVCCRSKVKSIVGKQEISKLSKKEFTNIAAAGGGDLDTGVMEKRWTRITSLVPATTNHETTSEALSSAIKMDRHQRELTQIQDPSCLTNWLTRGQVEFRNVDLYYNNKSDKPVLKKINFKLAPGEKVAIIGRTGAGKSSIMTTLFRLYDFDGSILVDDVDIKQLKLIKLRSSIGIIPQTPILFSTTIRKNLDPFHWYDDFSLWSSLDKANLRETVSSLPGKLDYDIGASGCCFSTGQKQLFCLARVLLRRNKLIVLDEATANIDPNTDAIIQTVIRSEFKHCTVMTIAHRLETIVDYDRIMVLDAGRIVDFDTPEQLMARGNSHLIGLHQNMPTLQPPVSVSNTES